MDTLVSFLGRPLAVVTVVVAAIIIVAAAVEVVAVTFGVVIRAHRDRRIRVRIIQTTISRGNRRETIKMAVGEVISGDMASIDTTRDTTKHHHRETDRREM